MINNKKTVFLSKLLANKTVCRNLDKGNGSLQTLIYLFLVLGALFNCSSALADIKADNTLGNSNSSVIQNQIINGVVSEVITNGTQQNSLLLHSLLKLNIDSGKGGFFLSPVEIKNIVVRVTGQENSKINGTLGVIGDSNLFIINPSGFIFGKEAKLDLSGSFTAATADSIIFPGYEFSAVNTSNSPPILQINTPIGLRFNKNTSNIIVENSGFKIFQLRDSPSPPTAVSLPPAGLTVQSGNSLSVIGGNINFDGAVLNTIASNINIGSVRDGIVDINSSDYGFSLSFKNVIEFGDIYLKNYSFILNNAASIGSINFDANNIKIIGGSTLLLNNVGSTSIGSININTRGDLSILGSPNELVPNGFSQLISGVVSSTVGKGDGGKINISASNLFLGDIGKIFSINFAEGKGGDISLNIKNLIRINEFPDFQSAGTLIGAISFGQANAGNINISSQNIYLENGANLVTATLGNGDAGNISIDSYLTSLSGYNTRTLSPTLLSSFTANDGSGGNLIINTDILRLVDGGRVDASTTSSGNAGSVFVNANYILVSGVFPAEFNGNSFISSSGNRLDPISASLYPGLILDLKGDAGSVVVTANKIDLNEGGQISVKNDGIGDAGKLLIFADEIRLNSSIISASTQGGNGGIIDISTSQLISQNSSISASAGGGGNGGNLSIDSNVIFGDSSSFLSANAEQGLGGQIKIQSTGFIFPRNNITAKSNAGSSSDGRIVISASATQVNQSSLYSPTLAQIEFLKGCKPDQRKSLAVINGSGTAPEQLTDPIENFGSSQITYYRLDLKTRQKIPLGKPMLSWKDNGNGTSSAIAELAEPDSVSSLPTFHCFDSNSNSAKAK
jgi:filamentous hemagglutinin family protein